MKKRIEELDFLKCVFIILMIVFHLVYIGDKYPYAKQLVYTFHMPAFLLISGYLVSISKKPLAFFRTMGWIFVPYAVMESGYMVMSSILPVRDGVDELSLTVWTDKLFLHPLGPYWYLHTLMLCSTTYYLLDRVGRRWLKNTLSFSIVLALCLAVESTVLHISSLPHVLYFWGGIMLRRCNLSFTGFFKTSWWGILPFIWLSANEQNLNCFTWGGMAMVYLAISMGLTVYPFISGKLRDACLYIGRNTFVILVFSPIFTVITKSFVSFFSFDASGMCFLIVSVGFVLAGSFLIAWCMDRCKVSRFFWGKERMLQ